MGAFLIYGTGTNACARCRQNVFKNKKAFEAQFVLIQLTFDGNSLVLCCQMLKTTLFLHFLIKIFASYGNMLYLCTRNQETMATKFQRLQSWKTPNPTIKTSYKWSKDRGNRLVCGKQGIMICNNSHLLIKLKQKSGVVTHIKRV